MAHTNQFSPSPSPSPSPSSLPSRQNKAISQREYREKEMECFNKLRDVISNITGEIPRTRLEILSKAIDLLSPLAGNGNQDRDQAISSGLSGYGTPNDISAPVPADSTLPHSDYPVQRFYWLNDEFGPVVPDNVTHVHDQQYHSVSATDPTYNQSSYPGYGEGCSQYRQFSGPY